MPMPIIIPRAPGSGVSGGRLKLIAFQTVALLHVGEQLAVGRPPGVDRGARKRDHVIRALPEGKDSARTFVVVQGEPELLQVVDALGTSRCLAGRLHGGEKERDENGDDGNHDQQLNQRECAALDDHKKLQLWIGNVCLIPTASALETMRGHWLARTR